MRVSSYQSGRLRSRHEIDHYVEHINATMLIHIHFVRCYDGMLHDASLHDLMGWLGPMISQVNKRWIGVGALIENLDRKRFHQILVRLNH